MFTHRFCFFATPKIIGIAIAAVGGILLWGKPLVRKFLDWLMERLQEVMQDQNSETIENMLNDLAKMAGECKSAIYIHLYTIVYTYTYVCVYMYIQINICS